MQRKHRNYPMKTQNTELKTLNRKYAPSGKELKELVDHYNTKGKLPTIYVQCTVSGEPIVLFGDNLERRVKAYGGIENVLTLIIKKDKIKELKSQGFNLSDIPARRTGTRRPKTVEEIDKAIESLQEQRDKVTAEIKAEKTPETVEAKS